MCVPARLHSAQGKGSHVALPDARKPAYGGVVKSIWNFEERCGLEERLAPPAAPVASPASLAAPPPIVERDPLLDTAPLYCFPTFCCVLDCMGGIKFLESAAFVRWSRELLRVSI